MATMASVCLLIPEGFVGISSAIAFFSFFGIGYQENYIYRYHLSQLHFSWQRTLRLCGTHFSTESELSQFVFASPTARQCMLKPLALI